jgi:GAF domain-containing protein/anti-sigma regulatory factor (Ser/Thr protein kinase)
VFDVEFRASGPTAGRSGLSLSASFFRLDDAQGRALGVCVVSVDVTDRRRAHERLAVLGEASKRIGTTLDVMRTAQELADLTVPLLADHATVDLAEAVWTGGEPVVRLGTQGGDLPAFRRAGLASVRQGAPESLFAPGEPVLVPPMSPFTGVLRDGKSHFEPALGTCPRTWLNPDVARVERDRDDTNHSLIVVPVHARGTVLGVAVFLRKGDRAPFEEDDLLLAEELVSWAALCLDNARRYARERSAALTLQRHLLPRHPTGGSAADVAWRYLPADSHRGVGGDWCDVIPLSGGRVALVVGDVVGHGINAAATMGQLRTAVRTLANLDLPCEEVLARLDEQVIRVAETDSAPWDPDPGTMAATCLYAVYDPVTRRCAMACAGHLPPAIVDPHGTVAFPELPTGAPLGVGLVPFESVELELPEGSVLAFYSDGLIEAPDHDIGAGLDRLSTALARPGLPLEELCTSVLDTLSTAPSSDDVTLLLARTHAFGPSRVASWEFPADPSAVSDARSLATAQLALWGLEDQAASTELIVSELVTNAVRHAGGPILLRLIRDHVLTCEVHDTGSCFPHLRHPRLTDDNGRGLFLVDQLSHRWGSRDTPDGKLLWAELHLTPAP